MSESPRTRRPAATAVIAAGATLATTALALLPGTASASSHREAPLIADAPAYDNTDLYAFVSPDKPDTVTSVSNWFGLQEPNGGPTFYPRADDARYNILIDSDGDAKPDVTYRYEFTTDNKAQLDTFLYANGPVETLDDENLLFKQYWTPTRIGEDGKEQVLYGGDLSEVGQDTLAGCNVNTTVRQVPRVPPPAASSRHWPPVTGSTPMTRPSETLSPTSPRRAT
ncbi:MAG: DUF4331 domain-containing protein [Pseudonocardia sp.]|nr:DUF4331 domain-containing protein [Pseudonocardia sp.]